MTTTAQASCHPDRPVHARRLCRTCYDHEWRRGTHVKHPSAKAGQRTTAEFVEDYTELRGYGLTRTQIAARLGMTRDAIDAAYRRATLAGLLNPDRKAAA